ncbi:MAG: hypothetical protein IKN63_02625 [Bacilli bacterium]|nr:hypothetical protein [Bacilli bacterium]
MDKLDNCLAKILNVIKVLQDNALKIDCIDNSCTKPFLGINTNLLCFNTRPIMLYLCNNLPITLNYTTPEGVDATTSVFRVESVTNDSVGVLLLEETTDASGNTTYLSTNTYATINLDCVCAIRCLADVIVTNL